MLSSRINEAKKSFWFGRLLSENSGLQSFLDRLRFTASCSKFFLCRSAVHHELCEIFLPPFTVSRSKFFLCRSAVHREPFENFLLLFSRSTSSIQIFSSAVHDSLFKRLGHGPFVIHSVAVRFAVRTDIR